MTPSNRRDFLQASSMLFGMPLAAAMNAGCSNDTSGASASSSSRDLKDAAQQLEAMTATDESTKADRRNSSDSEAKKEPGMQIHYLEFVTQDVDATCALYSKVHGVTFGEPDPVLGNARTAKLATGGMLGVRAPMHAGEKPVIRPYILVSDINAAVKAASDAGAEIAVPAMKLGNHGTCAIYFHHGLESALWQL
ncbi:MAG: hypothetical protein U0996_11505 [Planctomycetaceae bacterium]